MGHWWRWALVVAAVAVAVPSAGVAPTALFGVVPVAAWGCLARTRRVGVVVGVVLLVLLAWFALPHGLGWSGPWVPSPAELCWLYPLVAAVVCGIGGAVDGRSGCALSLSLTGVVLLGFLVALVDLAMLTESPPGDEGVLPAPPGLRVVDPDLVCGSGGCARQVGFAGDDARALVDAHLAAHGFVTHRPAAVPGTDLVCRVTGLLVRRQACAEVREAAGVVRVTWYVE
ncbi:hypothetical protein [Saccharothrix syringae]|uniref:Uncharacterized protein n=1 Tax=Saccharothrix syringae TaxID=103733 RepID=A0A5Q0H246_SACSY|nr:hypothetical protein [Saccharothrix syringae]QFZ20183.1 hypothetical protein EKG83_24695 [Saccharothrix syringae]